MDNWAWRIGRYTAALVAPLLLIGVFFNENKEQAEYILVGTILLMWLLFTPYTIYMVKKMLKNYYLYKFSIYGGIVFYLLFTIFVLNFTYQLLST